MPPQFSNSIQFSFHFPRNKVTRFKGLAEKNELSSRNVLRLQSISYFVKIFSSSFVTLILKMNPRFAIRKKNRFIWRRSSFIWVWKPLFLGLVATEHLNSAPGPTFICFLFFFCDLHWERSRLNKRDRGRATVCSPARRSSCWSSPSASTWTSCWRCASAASSRRRWTCAPRRPPGRRPSTIRRRCRSSVPADRPRRSSSPPPDPARPWSPSCWSP